MMMKRRLGVVASVATLVIAGSLAGAAPAGADTDQGRAQSVLITVTGSGSHARISNDDVHPGWLKLKIQDATSPKPIGANIDVIRLRHGYRLSRLMADLAAEVAQNSTPAALAAAAAATGDLNTIAVALGGGDPFDKTPFFRSDTIWLPGRGDYYVINTATSTLPAVVGVLEARGRTVWQGAPDHSGTVSLGNGSTDTITLTGHMPAKGTVRVRNNGDGVHLLAISKVADGTTDAEVSAEYMSFMTNGFPPPDPIGLFSSTINTGSDAVSPGHASLFSYNLPKGTYVLQCFVADDVTGIPHAFMGMHLIVHIG